ncbi:MAG: CBS domain-containing protein [Pseudomonadota bacterium]
MTTTPKILVRDYMRSLSLYFSPSDPVEKVAATLVKRGELGAPVLDEHKRLIGFVTEQDCIKEMLNDSYYAQEHQLVSDIMSRRTVSVGPNEDVTHLAEEMLGAKPKIYPVVEDGRVIGIITRGDVLRALSRVRNSGHGHI